MKRGTREEHVTPIRRVSSELFGSMYRLEVLEAIAGSKGGHVTARDIASSMLVPDNRVSPILHALVAAGRLRDVPGHDARERVYERVDGPLWPAVLGFVRTVRRNAEERPGRGGVRHRGPPRTRRVTGNSRSA